MQICKTCRHWDKISAVSDDLGVCRLIPSQQNRDGNLPAFVSDDDHYVNRLCTKPSFGCLAHEPRN
jgi:hypothetical protein